MLEGAAVVVVATVRQRREELVQQVAVRGVDLDGVEADRDSSAGGVGERLHDLADLLDGEGGRCVVPLEGDVGGRDGRPPAVVDRDRPGPRGPGAVGRRLAAGVGELDPDRGALAVHELDDPAPRLGLLVVPDPRVLRRDPALRHDGGGLGQHQPEPAGRPRAEVHQVPVVGHAVGRGVLAHRRQPDAVAQRQPTQRDRLEQLGQGFSSGGAAGHRDNRCSGATVPRTRPRHARIDRFGALAINTIKSLYLLQREEAESDDRDPRQRRHRRAPAPVARRARRPAARAIQGAVPARLDAPHRRRAAVRRGPGWP